MTPVNSWRSPVKQNDKFEIKIRFGRLTVLELFLDVSSSKWRCIFMNLGIES